MSWPSGSAPFSLTHDKRHCSELALLLEYVHDAFDHGDDVAGRQRPLVLVFLIGVNERRAIHTLNQGTSSIRNVVGNVGGAMSPR